MSFKNYNTKVPIWNIRQISNCLLSLALLMLTSVVSAQQSSDNYTMLKNVLSNGGNKSSSPNYQLVATIGQNATKKSTANGKVLHSGFYAPMGTQQPCNEAELAIIPDYKKVPNVDGTISFEIVSTNGCQAEWTIEGSPTSVKPNSGITPSEVTVKYTGILCPLPPCARPPPGMTSHCPILPCGIKHEYSVFSSNAANSPVTFTLQVGDVRIEQCPNATCNVSKTGSDTVGDGSEAKPFATIQYGIDVAKDDYTVLVHSGTYVENINFNGKNIIVKSTDGAEKTVIDGNQNGSVVQFANEESQKAILTGFTLTNGNGTLLAGYTHGGGIYVKNANPTIENMVILNNSVTSSGGGIHFEKSDTILSNSIIRNNIAGDDGGGISTAHSNVIIKNCLIAENKAKDIGGVVAGGGIRIHGYGSPHIINSTIANNSAPGSSGGGIMVYWNTSPVITNSIVYNNTGGEIKARSNGNPTITYSIVKGGYTGNGNLDTDPLFENGYHLSDYSPAIGAGTSTDAPEIDLEGTPRPNPTGSNPDMGAYENLLATPASECKAELAVTPFIRVLNWWNPKTTFELESTCSVNWTSKPNRPWLSVLPTTGVDDTVLNVTTSPSWWFRIAGIKTVASGAKGSPRYNLVFQKGFWWWWKPWEFKTFNGLIKPGKVISHPFSVAKPFKGPILFKVTWPGSDLDLIITTPSGKKLTADSPQVLEVYAGETEEYWLVESEEQGDWQVEVVAIEVDAAGEPYELSIIANERSEPPTEDTDNDGLPDEWETYFLGDLTQDGDADSDGDGVPNLREFQEGINPTSGDTDGDGKPDVDEIANYRAFGTILDKEDNPIADVTVQIDNDKTVVTDATGYWEINGLAEGEYTVTASKEGYLPDSKPCVVSVNEKVCQPRVKLEPVLDVKVVPEPRIAKQGEDVTYTITVTNQGEGTATDVTLVEGLPDNTDLVSIEALEGGSCEAETLTCNLPDLTPGATANVKVVVSNSQAETLINTVTVTTQQYPTDVKKTWTQVIPYLSVTVTDLPDPIEMLKVLHYSVAVELSHYAPTDATDVILVSQLPSGVELKSINSDYGSCDTSALPRITCSMTDLSIASADSTSHATVEIEVELKDAGLLLLTHQAKVTANEYPAHLVRERTTIFIPEGIQVDLAFVIDVTGSMQEEMNGVINALTDYIGEIDISTAPLMALLTFGDEVKVAAFTQDLIVLRGAIEDLTASGGGLCEEASIEALLVAIPHTQAGGNILFASDASPYDDADVDKVIELLRGKGIRFNAILTGDCTQRDSWNELPNDE